MVFGTSMAEKLMAVPIPRSRCLVTGGAGFIGSHLVEALVYGGAHVTVLDDLSTGDRQNVPNGVNLVRGDVRDFRTVAKCVRNQRYVFHLAAQVGNVLSVQDPLTNMEVNVGGSIKVFEAARKAGVNRIVYASSSAALGEARKLPQDEAHLCDPLSPYGVSKLSAEQYGLSLHRVHDLPLVSLRFFNVYGPRQGSTEYGNVIPVFFRLLQKGKPLRIFGSGRQTRDFTYVGDVVQAILRASQSSHVDGEVFHIGTGEATSILSLAKTMQRIAGIPTRIRHQPPRTGEVRHSVADIRKAQRLLGYRPKFTLPSGLRLTLNSFTGGKEPAGSDRHR